MRRARTLLREARRLAAPRAGRFAAPLEVERAETSFYLGLLREGMTVFDVGANVGELTRLFSRVVGTGTVHAFEPSAACFARLEAACDAFGRDNVVLNHVALADRAGRVTLHVYDDEHLGWNSLVRRPLARYGIEVEAPVEETATATTLDRYCAERGIERIDLLKLDVEGAEHQVMAGSRRMLSEKRVDCLTFEFGQTTFDMGSSPEEIATLLEEVGYEVRNLVGRDPVFPGGDRVETASFSMHVATPR